MKSDTPAKKNFAGVFDFRTLYRTFYRQISLRAADFVLGRRHLHRAPERASGRCAFVTAQVSNLLAVEIASGKKNKNALAMT